MTLLFPYKHYFPSGILFLVKGEKLSKCFLCLPPRFFFSFQEINSMTHFPPYDLFPWAKAPGAWPVCPTASSQPACSGFLLIGGGQGEQIFLTVIGTGMRSEPEHGQGICQTLWIHSWILTCSVPSSCNSSELVFL